MIVGNATIVNNVWGGYVYATLYPGGATLPTVSNLNYVPGQVVPNAFTVKLGNNGFNIYSTQKTDFIMDVGGYFA